MHQHDREKIMRTWRKFYECDCSSEGIMISFEQKPLKGEDIDPTLYLAFFTNGWVGQIKLWERLRYCFHVLKTGFPYNDMVCLNKKTASVLARDLLTFSKENHNNEDKKRIRK